MGCARHGGTSEGSLELRAGLKTPKPVRPLRLQLLHKIAVVPVGVVLCDLDA